MKFTARKFTKMPFKNRKIANLQNKLLREKFKKQLQSWSSLLQRLKIIRVVSVIKTQTRQVQGELQDKGTLQKKYFYVRHI